MIKMNADRINQFLVTCLVVVVLISQFNRTQTVEHINMTPRYSGENLSEDNPALSEEKYGLFGRLFNRIRPQRIVRQQSNCPGGICADCQCQNCQCEQQQPQNKQPSRAPIVNPNCPDGRCPLVPTSTKPTASKGEPVKTGMVRCSCCSRVIVGNDLHTEWTDSGEPVSPCCDDCWQNMTHQQRLNSVENWARRAGITDEVVLARYKESIK